MSPRSRAQSRGERGTAVLEMAIVAPLFFLLIFGMINFGYAFSVRENMIHSAQEGLRSALVAGSNVTTQQCTAESAARARMVGSIGTTRAGSESATSCTPGTPAAQSPAPDLTVTTSSAACSNSPGTCLTVTMSYPYRNDEIVAIPGFDNLAPGTISISVVERTS
jgi:Flp pilus assembly protein TadG